MMKPRRKPELQKLKGNYLDNSNNRLSQKPFPLKGIYVLYLLN
jgi:hypothetical protein